MHPSAATPYYQPDLALVHHLGFGFHAQGCAPGVLAHLRPVLERGGLVVELGCGAGALTHHLVEAGHRVVATDASPAMVELTRTTVPGAEARRLTLPDDPLPTADAVVSVGHVLNYLADEAAVERALIAVADALRPGGLLLVDLCDLRYGEVRRDAPPYARTDTDWAIISATSIPEPTRFVRDITTFVRTGAGTWRRNDERHDNVLLDTATIPGLLRRHGVDATLASHVGTYRLPDGLVAVVGSRRG